MKLAAVKNNGYVIRHIKHPSEEVQLAAVRQDWRSIEFIKNPSRKVQSTECGCSTKQIRNSICQ